MAAIRIALGRNPRIVFNFFHRSSIKRIRAVFFCEWMELFAIFSRKFRAFPLSFKRVIYFSGFTALFIWTCRIAYTTPFAVYFALCWISTCYPIYDCFQQNFYGFPAFFHKNSHRLYDSPQFNRTFIDDVVGRFGVCPNFLFYCTRFENGLFCRLFYTPRLFGFSHFLTLFRPILLRSRIPR